MTPRIIIPHGLAADVLRVLQCRRAMSCSEVVAAIDEARGIDDETPGVGFGPVWGTLRDLNYDGIVWRVPVTYGTLWRIPSLPVPVRDEPAEVSGEVG